MNPEHVHLFDTVKFVQSWHLSSDFIIKRAHSVFIFIALFCTLAVKLFHAARYGLLNEYISWILSDVAFFVFMEVILSLACFRWPKRWIVRTAIIIASVLCIWSVMNAGWLIRTGTQILPRVLLPLFRSPANALYMIGVNLIKMPKASFLLLCPSVVALTFLFYALARTRIPNYNRHRFLTRIVFCLALVLFILIVRPTLPQRRSPQAASAGMQFNAQIKALMSLMVKDYSPSPNPERKIPSRDQLDITVEFGHTNHNLVIVVLEGVQYRYTSLADESCELTPFLKDISVQGVEFTNTRSSLTHTTKALFALLTGRFPSASQDIAETVPVVKSYASLATVLSDKLNFRTAFFQSAKGDFEGRPGLVYNLGYQKFWCREDLNDPNCYVGYLGCDEFSMLKPVSEWIKSDERPFFLTVLCSVTHDPYEVPEWFGTPDREPLGRYKQAISYTDKFLAALDVELKRLNLDDETIFCVIGDHGEAFGEHGLLGHERISFEEVLHVPFCVRAPLLIEPRTKVKHQVSSIDLTPTLLGLLGFDIEKANFDGVNVLNSVSDDRRIFFAGWMQEGPAGYIQGNRKYIYDPMYKMTYIYDLGIDPHEQMRMEVSQEQSKDIADDIIKWRKNTIFQIDQKASGHAILFNKWNCRWTQRVSSTKLIQDEIEGGAGNGK
jgi:glucan phosphoethanolaminetransferase (alkaline phosphatase superfamily)